MSDDDGRSKFDESVANRLEQLDQLVTRAEAAVARLNEFVDSGDGLLASTTESKIQIESALAESKSRASEIAAFAGQVSAAQAQIVSDQAVIAAKSDHIEKAQEHAGTVRANLDRALTAVMQQQTEAEGFRARAQASAEAGAQSLADVTASKSAADKDADAVRTALDQAKESAVKAKSLADRADQIDERVAAYEARLAEFESTCLSQLKAIEGLLPGATSAGLAHAFDERRKTFLKPSARWQWLFVGSVALLVLLAITGLWHVYQINDVLSYDALFRLWLARLPIAGALIWLALYASRESALAKRLEEDYGYKAVVAASFQGFHKQMSEVVIGADANAPAVRLCVDTLATIASPPGRIYEKHALTVSPSGELTDAAKTVVAAVKG